MPIVRHRKIYHFTSVPEFVAHKDEKVSDPVTDVPNPISPGEAAMTNMLKINTGPLVEPPVPLVGQFLIIANLGVEDAEHLQMKDASYGSSWRKRGGSGAFHQGLSRKWDRLENICAEHGYDIFKAIEHDNAAVAAGTLPKENHVLEQLRDLRRYLFLVDSWMLIQSSKALPSPNSTSEFEQQSDDPNPYTARQ